ncbi:MAG: GTP-binding protein [Candidatus Liptonbacteria bacterium]|nr:GTP-binding protein [Candidatus Liptonbacteria bacterium]
MADPITNKEAQQPRPPIVAVMGHVDHGKTTLLDYIRKANVATKEAGGITQAISAYEITHTPRNDAGPTQNNAEETSPRPSFPPKEDPPLAEEKEGNGPRLRPASDGQARDSASSPRVSALPEGKKITFIDTPGHEAFTHMRSRGARVADLAILVVAADESVKPQTLESIEILKQTQTPFVVAITKADRPGANPDKVKNDLMNAGVLLEGYGGQVSWHLVSAKSGEGVDDLLDLVLLTAEMESLSYDPAAPGSGFILEARLSKQRGIEVAVVLKNGTLKRGDPISTPTAGGRIKMLENFLGEPVDELLPAAPVLIVGFESVPAVGEEFILQAPAAGFAPSISSGRGSGELGPIVAVDDDAVNLVLKASDAGSLEALVGIVRALKTPRPIRVVAESIGEIIDRDVKFAASTGASIVGFKVKAHKVAQSLAELQHVPIAISEIIYELVRTIEQELAAATGAATVAELDVLAVFNGEKISKQLIGARVISGDVRLKASFEVQRENKQVGLGHILSLRRAKDDVTVLPNGVEGGLLVECNVAIAVGDKLLVK